tara:strand:- start:179 stop:1447 length:1269 start_codon:yes stop_codon:yes gene_type:complete
MRIEIKNKKQFIQMFNSIYNVAIEDINGISIDSRKIKQNDIYFPIAGNYFNGHDFIESVFKNGAIISFSEKKINNKKIIKVKSIKNELYKLCKYWSELSNSKVIGITGSNGKTTTKNLIYNILKQKYKCSKTRGNYNSTLGLPLTYLSTSLNDDYCILEYGASKPNEIEKLCKIVQPYYSLVTNISNAHIKNYKSYDDIYKTKIALYKFTNHEGTAFINSDNISIDCNEIKSKIEEFNLSNEYIDKKIIIPKKISHITDTIKVVAFISKILGIKSNLINNTLKKFSLPKGRGNIIKYKNYSIIDDSYNANPESLKFAIKRLNNTNSKGKKIIVIGDMLELGNHDISEHEKISEEINKSNIDVILTFGNLTKHTNKYIERSKYSKHYTSIKKLKIELNNIVCNNDLVYLKGSRSMKLEQIYNI